ncbi:MAG: lipid-A-disaccharide synthase [Tannerella sp.]|jgi:lipid A disaccharide synthetase|nr:lipid-A-disaccharide synthase [Tannerella sp.]
MKYYLIAGEASGDLHASNLMAALKKEDLTADFRFFGGDLMRSEGGTLVGHYRETAYMGVIPVLLHLRTILRNMRMCREDIRAYNPDVVILVDYPGFNLKMAKFVKTRLNIPVYYYISPKIWAWKKYRIKSFRRYVDRMFCILPFETEFFKSLNYPVDYVGNPSVDSVSAFRESGRNKPDTFVKDHGLTGKPVIAILAGSRKAEIKQNLPAMLSVAERFPGFQPVIAGAPGLTPDDYKHVLKSRPATGGEQAAVDKAKGCGQAGVGGGRDVGKAATCVQAVVGKAATDGEQVVGKSATGGEQLAGGGQDVGKQTGDDFGVKIVYGQTCNLLEHASVALVTSGTATLETALFRVPQVVCYYIGGGRLINFVFDHFFHVPYISLVNLIAGKQVVQELFGAKFSGRRIYEELRRIIEDNAYKEKMLKDYDRVISLLGDPGASTRTAKLITDYLSAPRL